MLQASQLLPLKLADVYCLGVKDNTNQFKTLLLFVQSPKAIGYIHQ